MLALWACSFSDIDLGVFHMAGLTWLHLSDWHQTSKDFKRAKLRDALVKDIQTRDKISTNLAKIDFIAFSGDVAFFGKPLHDPATGALIPVYGERANFGQTGNADYYWQFQFKPARSSRHSHRLLPKSSFTSLCG